MIQKKIYIITVKKDNKVSISDIYQIYAYAKKYKTDKLVLIYPKWQHFNKCFHYELDHEKLYIYPFDLYNAEESANNLLDLIYKNF